jgi:osmotically-inducible protein OsmY
MVRGNVSTMKTHRTTRQQGMNWTRTGRRFLMCFAMSAALISHTASIAASEIALESAADSLITSEVKSSLLFNLLISSKTETRDGVVTLSGSVDTIAEKVLGTNLATGISGVRQVINNMVIAAALTGNN